MLTWPTVDLAAGKGAGEVDAAIDALHSHAVLLILVEVAEDLEQVSLWNVRNQLDHVVQHEGSTFAHLWDLILRCLHK